jgi:hypothetical protein
MSVQTSYPDSMTNAFAGMRADNGPGDVVSRLNASGGDLPFGIAVAQDAEGAFDSLDSGDTVLGVLQHTHAWQIASLSSDSGVASGAMANVLKKGRIYVQVEDAVTAGALAYARHTSDGGDNTQKGKFRSDVDGVAQVTTVTPTSANDTKFSLDVFVDGVPYHFEYTSDSASSATEICDGFRALMAADAAFTALVVASGTATLILTGQAEGMPFYVSSGGSPGAYASITTGTPASARAQAVPGCRYETSGSAGDFVVLEVNLPA